MGYKRQSGPDTIYALSDPLGRSVRPGGLLPHGLLPHWVVGDLKPRRASSVGPGVGLDDYIGRLTANIRSNRTASPSTQQLAI